MKKGTGFSGLSRLSLVIIAVILSIVLLSGSTLAGSYEIDKKAPAKAGD
ncbi:hypothetical protein [Methanolacinia petrolearia]